MFLEKFGNNRNNNFLQQTPKNPLRVALPVILMSMMVFCFSRFSDRADDELRGNEGQSREQRFYPRRRFSGTRIGTDVSQMTYLHYALCILVSSV